MRGRTQVPAEYGAPRTLARLEALPRRPPLRDRGTAALTAALTAARPAPGPSEAAAAAAWADGLRRAAPPRAEPRVIVRRYFHEQPPRLRAVSAPHLSKAVYRPRHLRPVEAKEPYRLWSSTAPPLGPGCIPACVASIYPA